MKQHGLTPLADLDISPLSKPNFTDSKIIKKIMRHEKTGRAIVEFDKYKSKLSDYGYWFVLSTLWVSYTGWSDLRLWKRLFNSNRPSRKLSIMKPSEVRKFDQLPESLSVYRAKREGELDCIAYTLNPEIASTWAVKRGVSEVHCYEVNKQDVLALFLRRNEHEIIVLDQSKVRFTSTMKIVNDSEEADKLHGAENDVIS